MKRSIEKEDILPIIGNKRLASDIYDSVASALSCPFFHFSNAKTIWDIFKHSLNASIRDIEADPRGILFQRLIEYGPLNPGDPDTMMSDHKTILSDSECGSCVEFIYSLMVNRFKGDLAELLTIEPLINLTQKLIRDGNLPEGTQLFWGESIQERRRVKVNNEGSTVKWGSFAKGADGLMIEQANNADSKCKDDLKIMGVVEVKSMNCSKKKVLDQINRHVLRLQGGVKLADREWSPDCLHYEERWIKGNDKPGTGLIRVLVLPSNWKLNREWNSENTDQMRTLLFNEFAEPPFQTQIHEIASDFWKITLAWSQEALEQAAYEMTFWYMSQVGRHVYASKQLPKGWEYMTIEEAGHNAIKMMLFYILLRNISQRQERIAIKLYNVYCFGFPLGAHSKKMLWPEDFPDEEEK